MRHILKIRLRAVSFCLSVMVGSAGLAACDMSGPPAAVTPAVVGETIPRGQVVFARYCHSCHPNGGLGAGPSILTIDPSDEEMTNIIRHGKNRMPGFNEKVISDEELVDLIAHIDSLRQ